MADPAGGHRLSRLTFFRAADPPTLGTLAERCGARLLPEADPSRTASAASLLDRAASDEVAFYAAGIDDDDLRATRAGACFVSPQDVWRLPPGTIALLASDPAAAFRRAAAILHPDSSAPGPLQAGRGLDPGARIDADVLLEDNVTIEPGAIIGSGVEIGSGTFIGANAVVAPGVRVGRGCAIDACVFLSHALLGDRVVIHAGARIGLGSLRSAGHWQGEPALGRVIIQNDVEVGANSVVHRGRAGDTVIGEGGSVASLVVVAADTLVGRNVVFRGSRDRVEELSRL